MYQLLSTSSYLHNKTEGPETYVMHAYENPCCSPQLLAAKWAPKSNLALETACFHLESLGFYKCLQGGEEAVMQLPQSCCHKE